jgi:hypothetical protein
MKKQYLIDVTQEHIDKGRKFNAQRCPISLAIKESTGKNNTVGIGGATLYRNFFADGRYELPLSARLFIINFDGDRSVEPFSFILEKK